MPWPPYTVSRNDSIGSLFQDALFGRTSIISAVFYLSLLIIVPALILGWFLDRKRIAWLFFIAYPIIFFIPIVYNREASRLSDIIVGNIHYFYPSVLFILIAFFSSMFFNRFRKKKHKYSKKDYIPLWVMVGLTILLTLLPIRIGHLACKGPFQKHFSCTTYLEYEESSPRGWFVY